MNRTLWLRAAMATACLVAILVAASSHPSPADAFPLRAPCAPPADRYGSVYPSGYERKFVWAVSNCGPPALGRPLVIFLHGDGGNMGLTAAWKNAVLYDANGAVLLSAQGRNATPGCPLDCGSAWRFRMDESGQPYDDIDFINEIITQATTNDNFLQTHIYPYQVYVVGESRGGGFAYYLYTDPRTADKVRAMVALSGSFYCNLDDHVCGDGGYDAKPSLFTVPNVRHAAHILDVHGQPPGDTDGVPVLDTDYGASKWVGWGNAAGCYTTQLRSETLQVLAQPVDGKTVNTYAYSQDQNHLATRCALDLTFYIVQGGGHVPAGFEPIAWQFLSNVDHPGNTLPSIQAAMLAAQASLADIAAAGISINLPLIQK